MKIAVLGLGYVGTVTAACLSSAERQVHGVDPDSMKVDLIEAGRSPVIEPRVDELVSAARSAGYLRATTSSREAVADADVVLLSVGTPSEITGATDLRYIERAATDVGEAIRDSGEYVTTIVRSTVPPGTVDEVVAPAIERASGRRRDVDFGVAMCPEFLREGSGVADFFDPPFTVVGADDERAAKTAAEVFSFLDAPVHSVSLRTAEALKYSCNAFHAVKVSFANEVGRLCRSLGVDAREVMEIFVEDTQLNISPAYLRPGFAFGGSCLPKDLRSLLYLARMSSVDLPLLSGTIATNEIVVRNLVRDVLATGARRVALLGLSFKPETDDLRESPLVEAAERLIGKGAEVTIYDPIVRPERLFGANRQYVDHHLPHLWRQLVDSPEASLADAEAAIVATRVPEVVQALLASPPGHVFDVNGQLGPDVEALPGYAGVSW